MTSEQLLEQNGWIVECESPFEIRHEDGSFATLNAAYIILDELKLSYGLDNMITLMKSYKLNLIDKDMFVSKIITEIEKL